MTGRGDDFDEFVVGSSARLLQAAYALTGDRQAAQDLLQDVLERLFVAWPRVDDPRAYTHRALVNHSRNRWRRRSRHPEVALTTLHETAIDDATATSDDRDALVRALAALAPRQRAVIVLRYLEDLSEADTATALSCSVGTVKSQSARALATLRSVLSDAAVSLSARSTT